MEGKFAPSARKGDIFWNFNSSMKEESREFGVYRISFLDERLGKVCKSTKVKDLEVGS
jgi:hypothetical protein